MTWLSFNCQGMFQEDIPVYHLQLANNIHETQPLSSICAHSSPTCQHLSCVWWSIHHVSARGSVCTRCMQRLLCADSPKEQSSYEVFWKFYCKFAMLVSVFWQMVLGCCTVEVAYGISKNLPCLLFLIEALNLSGLCNCFLKQLTRECQGTNFLTCNDLWCHKFSDPVSPSTEVCKWR